MHALNSTQYFGLIINYLINNKIKLIDQSLDDFSQIPEFTRSLLVFVNPHSGSGQGPRKWYESNIILGLLILYISYKII